MKRILILFFVKFLFISASTAQTIVVTGNKFTVEGNEIYLNGVNAPWQWQSDCDINFMRHNFDKNFWETELQKYVDSKVNVVRVWLHGSGNYSPALNGSGYVTAYGVNDLFWQNMDTLVAIAARKKIYLMPTFWSFDMASTNAYYYPQYRQILTDDNRAGSYLNNFLIPFVQRYKNNNWIMGYDLCNEPEHIWRDANCGNLSAYWVTRFFARCAAAVHQNCSQPVTIGAMWAVYNSTTLGNGDGDTEGGFNRYSDANMKNYYNDVNAYLDFYSPHWYQWQGTNGPFNRTVSQWIGANDKPVITGETYGGDLAFVSMADFYLNSYHNGFDGTMGWKNACQNDGYGTWNGVKAGTLSFYNQYPTLVYPSVSLSLEASSIKALTEDESVTIFPIPVGVGKRIHLQFSGKNNERYRICLYTGLGQIVFQKELLVESDLQIYSMEIHDSFATGYYQLELISASGDRRMQKIVME